MNFFRIVFYIATILAGLISIGGIIFANGAPQQAAAAACGVFFIFLPYSIVRVMQGDKLIQLQEAAKKNDARIQ